MNTYQELQAPFSADALKWRAGATTRDKSRTMALAYIDARTVMDRLDEVIGFEGWYDSYRVVHVDSDRVSVQCDLTINGVTKSDVGTGSGNDYEMMVKGAYSDALKRAAVKFGVGRYIYDLPSKWVDYDDKRKQISAGAMQELRNIAQRQPTRKPAASRKQREPVGRNQRDHIDADNQKALDSMFKIDGLTLEPEEAIVYRNANAFLQTAVDHIARYSHQNAIINTLKLFGYDGIPNGTDEKAAERVRMYRRLVRYATRRDAGMSQDDALADVNRESALLERR